MGISPRVTVKKGCFSLGCGLPGCGLFSIVIILLIVGITVAFAR